MLGFRSKRVAVPLRIWVGGVGGKRLGSSFAPQGFLRLGLGGRSRGWEGCLFVTIVSLETLREGVLSLAPLSLLSYDVSDSS